MAVYKDEKRKTWYFKGKVRLGNIVRDYQKRGYATKKECKTAEVLFLEELQNKDKRTVKTIWEDYRKYCKTRKSKGTFLSEEHRYEKHLKNYFQDMVFVDITATDIVDWQNSLTQTLSNSYVNTLLSLLRNIFNFANDILDIRNTAISKVTRLKEDKNSSSDVWSYSEFKQFYDNIDDAEMKVFFRVLYFTGLRRGEILGLQWKDFQGNKLDINKSYSKHGLDELKTKNSYRIVTLDGKTKRILDAHKKRCMKLDGFNDDFFIFGGSTNMYLERPRKYKDRITKKIGLRNIRLHDFRHSHVSILIANNVPVTAIANRIGDSVEVVLNTYSHMLKESEDVVLSALEDLE